LEDDAMALSGSAVLDKQWVCEVIRRLRAERGEDTHLVRATVHDCRHDLAGAPAGALPELVERLARQRLLEAEARHHIRP
jgi:hypothetical protein